MTKNSGRRESPGSELPLTAPIPYGMQCPISLIFYFWSLCTPSPSFSLGGLVKKLRWILVTLSCFSGVHAKPAGSCLLLHVQRPKRPHPRSSRIVTASCAPHLSGRRSRAQAQRGPRGVAGGLGADHSGLLFPPSLPTLETGTRFSSSDNSKRGDSLEPLNRRHPE